MAKQRVLNTKFWSDNFIVGLNPLDRYLFIYFLTNEKTELCGIYEVPLKTMANETGIEIEMLKTMIKNLGPKVFYIDGWVHLPNFSKHQQKNPSVEKGKMRSLALVPEKILNKIKELEQTVTDCDSVRQIVTPEPVLIPEPIPKGYAPKNGAEATKKKKENTDPLNVLDFIKSMRESPQRHMNIIAEYADTVRPMFQTKGQWRVFTDRNVRPAMQLSAFTDTQITNAFLKIKQNLKTPQNQKGYLTKWTLETLLKFINEK